MGASKVRSFEERYARMVGATVELIRTDGPESQYQVTGPEGRHHLVDTYWSQGQTVVERCDCEAFQFNRDERWGCIHIRRVIEFLDEKENKSVTMELTTRDVDLAPTNGTALPAMLMREVLTPKNVAEALHMAKLFHQSGMFAVQSEAQAFVILSMGMELGLSATQAFRSIHVIKGKPCLSADLMVGLCKASPACRCFELVESTDEIATYRTQRKGESETAMSFTMKDAQRAGLVVDGGNWRKYPAAMLRARAASALARAVYPDVCAGMYTPDEMLNVVPDEVQPIVVNQQAVEQHVLEHNKEWNDAKAYIISKIPQLDPDEWKAYFKTNIRKWNNLDIDAIKAVVMWVDAKIAQTPAPDTKDDPFADTPSEEASVNAS